MPILLLISAFLLLCLFYGIHASVSAVSRGTRRIRSRSSTGVDAEGIGGQCDAIAQLRALFALYRSGALTVEEFEQCKRRLLFGDGAGLPFPRQ